MLLGERVYIPAKLDTYSKAECQAPDIRGVARNNVRGEVLRVVSRRTKTPEETTMISTPEELDYRENNGIAVSLLWDRRTSELTVRVRDDVQGEEFDLTAGADEALGVFHHPFAYAARAIPLQLVVATDALTN